MIDPKNTVEISVKETAKAISMILDIEDNIFPKLCDNNGKPVTLSEIEKCVYIAIRLIEQFSPASKNGKVGASQDEIYVATKAVQFWYKNNGRDIITSLGGLVSIIKGGLLPEVAAQVKTETIK